MDFKTHVIHCAGHFAQSHEDETIKNNDSPRTLDCEHLFPSADRQERHDSLHLETNIIMNSKKFVPVTKNEWCVKNDHSIDEYEGMPKGTKNKRQE